MKDKVKRHLNLKLEISVYFYMYISIFAKFQNLILI